MAIQLLLGRSRRPDPQHKHCFFCNTAFTFKRDDIIVVADGVDWIAKVPERHVCPRCAELDDAGLVALVRKAAERHRSAAAGYRTQAEAEDALADRIDALDLTALARVWTPGTV